MAAEVAGGGEGADHGGGAGAGYKQCIGEHPINANEALLPWNIAKPATLSVAA
ncbi:MAG: hypothetical protein ACLPWS_10975 [Rhodomicrobium sp.]